MILGSDTRMVPFFLRVGRPSDLVCVLDGSCFISRHSAPFPNEEIKVIQARAFGADERTRGLLLRQR